jgi:hypothetical protein
MSVGSELDADVRSDSAPTHPQTTAGRRVPLAGRLALILFGLVAALAMTEATLHVIGPRLPGLYNLATFQRYHPIYGFFHPPGARGWIRTDEFTSYVQINARGLRDRETEIPKPAGDYRILLLGDSFVEGSQVALDQTISKQLERLLGGGQGGAAHPLETVNAGNAGFGTAQEVLFLEHEGPTYQPDVVVLVFYVDNDTANNGYRVTQKMDLDTDHRPFFVLDDEGRLQQRPLVTPAPEALGPVKDFLRQHSLLFSVGENLLTAHVSAKRYHAMRMGSDRTMYKLEQPPTWEEAWQVTEALLARARDSAHALNAELVVVCAPSQFQIYEDDWYALLDTKRASIVAQYAQDAPDRRLAEIAERNGLRLVDLLPAMRAAADASDTPLYYRDDGHWTPAGHALAARVLAGYLNEQGLASSDGAGRLAISP